MTQLSDAQAIRDDTPPAELASAMDAAGARRDGGLLVMVAAMPAEQLQRVVAALRESFSPLDFLIATPSEAAFELGSGLSIISVPSIGGTWPLSAADFANAWQVAEARNLGAILMLGPESGTLGSTALRELPSAVLAGATDLVMPCYELPVHAGLVNSAILFPVVRALFASHIRFPLAIDLALSRRMAERLAIVAKSKTGNPGDLLLWPVSEASVGGFAIQEVDVGTRALPQPHDTDFNSMFAQVVGSLFADIEAKAAFWQRARRVPPRRPQSASHTDGEGTSDVLRMIEAFRLANTNLQEIWALVLSPNSLVGLKRLSSVEPADFRMPEGLWARIVFDFLIAYKLRVINRSHLLGALIPIYLAWVAGHISITRSGTTAEQHIEAVAAAFEADKPYLVSRWRWPDRFNP